MKTLVKDKTVCELGVSSLEKRGYSNSKFSSSLVPLRSPLEVSDLGVDDKIQDSKLDIYYFVRGFYGEKQFSAGEVKYMTTTVNVGIDALNKKDMDRYMRKAALSSKQRKFAGRDRSDVRAEDERQAESLKRMREANAKRRAKMQRAKGVNDGKSVMSILSLFAESSGIDLTKVLTKSLTHEAGHTNWEVIGFNGYFNSLGNPYEADTGLSAVFNEFKREQENGLWENVDFTLENSTIGGDEIAKVLDTTDFDENTKVILAGHSYGADAAVELAEALQIKGVEVEMLFAIDLVALEPSVSIPANVKQVYNYYQKTGAFDLGYTGSNSIWADFWGGRKMNTTNSATKLHQVDVTKIGKDHSHIDDLIAPRAKFLIEELINNQLYE